jgi:aspartyl protease family protein
MKVLLFLTIIAGLAAGLLWPAPEAAEQLPPGAVEVELSRSADGHFYADGRVNGRTVRFLVDTGSSSVTLTPDLASELGLPAGNNQMIGHGASGLVRGYFVEVDGIEVGALRQTAAKVAVVEGSSIALLGQPFLEQLDEIVIRKDRMLLRGRSGP